MKRFTQLYILLFLLLIVSPFVFGLIEISRVDVNSSNLGNTLLLFVLFISMPVLLAVFIIHIINLRAHKKKNKTNK